MYKEMSHHKGSHLGAHCDVPFVHPSIPHILSIGHCILGALLSAEVITAKYSVGKWVLLLTRGFGTFAPESCPLQVSESLPGNWCFFVPSLKTFILQVKKLRPLWLSNLPKI